MAKELTTESYIQHHLTNLTCGKTPDGWTCDPYKVEQMGFWAFQMGFYAFQIVSNAFPLLFRCASFQRRCIVLFRNLGVLKLTP